MSRKEWITGIAVFLVFIGLFALASLIVYG